MTKDNDDGDDRSYPVHENDVPPKVTKAREAKLRKIIAEKWEIRCEESAAGDFNDGFIYQQGELVGIVEFKCRTCARTDHPDYVISTKKMANLRALAEEHEVPAFLVIAWLGDKSVGWHRVRTGYLEKRGGRYDRNRSSDQEMMARVPFEEFWPLAKVPAEYRSAA